MTSILERLEPWTTTGVGSLPHRNAPDALAYLTMAYGLPFCPQLPRLDGDMIAQFLGAQHGRCGWSPERDRARPHAWEALLAELRQHPPEHRIVKLQVTGPVTLGCALDRSSGGKETPTLATELALWLAANAREQVAELAERGFDTVLVVDEPALAMSSLVKPEAAWEPLRDVASAWGLHLCCTVPWATVDRARPDLLSFDLSCTRVDPEAAASLAELVRRGGWIAWGAVAAHRNEHPIVGLHRLRSALARIPEAGERSVLTPSCGTGRLTERRERTVAIGLRDMAAALRERVAATTWP